jgi:hypothetical protein
MPFCCRKFSSIVFIFFFIHRLANAQVPSLQERSAYGFAARYHADMGYLSGAGVGLNITRGIASNRFAGVVGVEYATATQTLVLVGGSSKHHIDLYRGFIALRGNWRPKPKSRLACHLELQSGWLFLRPRAWTLDAGVLGRITFQPKAEAKFAPAWSGGAAFRVVERMQVFLSVKQNFSRFARRQIDVYATTMVWRPYWHYRAGLSWHF